MIFSAQLWKQGNLCPDNINKIYDHSIINKRFMRISFLTIMTTALALQMLSAAPIKGQDIAVEKVSVGLNSESITSGIRQIENQTNLRFFYRKNEISTLSKLDLSFGRRTIEQTLYLLLQNSNISYRQIDQNILLQINIKPHKSRIITGRVLSLDTKEPLRYASVELIRKSDSQLAGQCITDSSGIFRVMTTDQSAHLIRISLLGYHLYNNNINDTEDISLPPVYLEPDPKQLKEVFIALKSPMVKQEVDRLTYDVQSDPDNKFSSLLDMLRKVPMVSVDGDDNVKVKGSASFKVLIDGKVSSLVVNNPKDIFRSMSASNIQRIEVILIPPAKYDGEGLAGILNIVTVKRTLDGYNGNAGVYYKFPNGPRSSGSFNYKRRKFALVTYAGWNEWNTPQTNFSLQKESQNPVTSVTDQQGTAHTRSNLGFVSTQVSYEIDSLNLVSAIYNYNGGQSHREGSVLTKLFDSSYSQYQLDNDGRTSQHGTQLGLDYQLGFRRNKAQFLSFSYRYGKNRNLQTNFLDASNLINEQITDYSLSNHSGTYEHTAQTDLVFPLQHLMIEGGFKGIFRNNYSDYSFDPADLSNTSILADDTENEQFSYQQNIYSIYNSYELKINKWTAKLGFRLERTSVKANFSNSGNLEIPNYTNILPSFAVQRSLSHTASINFGYSERILRPGIMQLNPYVDKQNPDFITNGNPLLRPELNHIISVNYNWFKKVNVNIGSSYTFSGNTIQYVTRTGSGGIIQGNYENLGTNNNLELDLNINYPVNDVFTVSLNAQSNYIRLKGIVEDTELKRNILNENINLNLSYKLGNNWRTSFNFLYFSPAKTLQATSSTYYYTSISLSKAILKKKLTLSGSASNPFLKYLNYRYSYQGPGFTQVTHNEIVYRRFNLGMSYNFGKLIDGSIKKNRKTIENNDIKSIPSTIPNN